MGLKKMFFLFFVGVFVSIPLMLACSRQTEKAAEMEKDVHSNSNPEAVQVTHLELDLAVNFPEKTIYGVARLHIDNKAHSDTLILDTRELAIKKVTLSRNGKEQNTAFLLGEKDPILGRALKIRIALDTRIVNVYYKTTPGAAALQWLDPSQTAGKRFPYLFTQSQPILARTWVPCQDSPGVRMTYSARVTIELPLLVLMSAQNPKTVSRTGIYTFEMAQPVPSYLLAMAIGNNVFSQLGPRSGVYAEPELIDQAAWEFADTEKMIAAAEKLYGPYRWERYDLLVLPPSFPFGGMENPRLTFATPTVLAGDRSLVALVAHELAHSWSGNLVTNATWNDFWLNEGFTVYFERRILEALYGRGYSEMQAQLGYQDLLQTIEELGANNPDTQLHMNLAGRDPDEAITDIPYEKGYFFLRLLEEHFGRAKWDAFLRKYFDTFAFQSMTTERFHAYLKRHLLGGNDSLENKLKIREWLYEPGLPANCPVVRSEEFTKVDAQVERWLGGTPAKELDTHNWTTQHWLRFLRQLPEDLNTQQMKALDDTFHFTRSKNSEILDVWLLLAIKHDYHAAYPVLENFLTGQGRRKFLKPLYQELAKTSQGLEMARRIYAKARPMYHSISRNTIDEIVGWKKTAP